MQFTNEYDNNEVLDIVGRGYGNASEFNYDDMEKSRPYDENGDVILCLF
jgi:hypothetical protein